MLSPRRDKTQNGISLFVAILSLLFIVPMAGLMIDVAVIYVVKSRLQAAVDGASLAAARALSLGQTTAAQASSAQQNAVNWFYANFPAGNWGTSGTQMDTGSVSVFDDPTIPQLRNVTITASTNAPTYFMKWFNYSTVRISANGNASRRDVVIMMVLDRSGSMQTAGVCGDMIAAAKVFTGQFAAGRDRIGLVSFSDNVYLHSAPTTNFQTTLGYTNGSGSANGAIDTITCHGGTSTAQAIAVAENELVRVNLPGALNILMFETDGLPNTLNLNFWDSSTNTPLLLYNSSPCTDRNGRKYGSGTGGGGFLSAGVTPNWTPGRTIATSSATNVPAGMIGEIYSFDPSQVTGSGPYFYSLMNYYVSGTAGFGSSPSWVSSTNCSFDGGTIGVPDFSAFPAADIYGNQLNPANAYKSVTMNGSYVAKSSTNLTAWTNYHGAVLNATDNAAYRARTNATIPAYFFGIGLGGTAGATDQPDYILMQRMANDPNGDNYNTPPKYLPCAQEANCITYNSQPQGTFIFSADATQLSRAFLQISSQILRLSK